MTNARLLAGRRVLPFVAAVLALTLVATASSAAPYDDAFAQQVEYSDALGSGTASATSAANKATGAVSVDTSAAADAPGGVQLFGTAVGASEASANAFMLHRIAIPSPGLYKVTVTFSDVTGSASISPAVPPEGYNQVSYRYAQARALASWVVEVCDASGSCTPHYVAGKYGNKQRIVTCAPDHPAGVCPAPPLSVTFEGAVELDPGQTGRILVLAGLEGSSIVHGSGSGQAAAGATVSGITLTAI